VAYAVAFQRTLCFLSDQCNQQESLQGHQHSLPLGRSTTKGYERGEWATYQQWQEKGGQVRKGEKATLVVFWKFANDTNESQEGATSHSSRLLFTRGYSVFNTAQVDGYTPTADADISMQERIAHAEMFFKAIGADVRHGGNQAYYAPATDHVQMPPFPAFTDKHKLLLDSCT
jgi:antirestriction protein ArdC